MSQTPVSGPGPQLPSDGTGIPVPSRKTAVFVTAVTFNGRVEAVMAMKSPVRPMDASNASSGNEEIVNKASGPAESATPYLWSIPLVVSWKRFYYKTVEAPSAAHQKILATKPTLGHTAKLRKLSDQLPDMVPEATDTDNEIHRVITQDHERTAAKNAVPAIPKPSRRFTGSSLDTICDFEEEDDKYNATPGAMSELEQFFAARCTFGNWPWGSLKETTQIHYSAPAVMMSKKKSIALVASGAKCEALEDALNLRLQQHEAESAEKDTKIAELMEVRNCTSGFVAGCNTELATMHLEQQKRTAELFKKEEKLNNYEKP
ncbi:hypothetical protein DFH08DRAFT_819852 [Mycena albidolilacea]|uniref:Uncharacterized protein n=1 Tax=Mycena albidolilacea TaxID=1033008 RepID=A0AAD6ZE24_9AGAR|nr:hypothetical protein DFH08DRAFT_819852 [Mycena albidolilacea]